MELRTCEACGHAISLRSFRLWSGICPNCGKRNSAGSYSWTFVDGVIWVVWIALALFVGGSVAIASVAFLQRLLGDKNDALFLGFFLGLQSFASVLAWISITVPGLSGRMVRVERTAEELRSRRIDGLIRVTMVPLLLICVAEIGSIPAKIAATAICIPWTVLIWVPYIERYIAMEWRAWSDFSSERANERSDEDERVASP